MTDYLTLAEALAIHDAIPNANHESTRIRKHEEDSRRPSCFPNFVLRDSVHLEQGQKATKFTIRSHTIGIMNPLANLNGKIMPLEDVTISPLDRGIVFSAAVYEVLRVYQAKPGLLRFAVPNLV